MSLFGYDLVDPGLFDNGFPHRIFSGIRLDCPVAWHYPPDNEPHVGGFWSVASYGAVCRVFEAFDVSPDHPASTVDDAVDLAVLELARRPDLWSILRAGEIPLNRAADELARWVCPVAAESVVATVDLPLGSITISAGEPVTCWLASANRDEAIFGRDAMELRLDRTPNPHLSFVGAPHLAEAFRARIDTLVRETSVLVVTGEPEWQRSTERSALSLLPVELVTG